MHREWHLPEILGSFGKCNGLWPLQEPHLLRLSFSRIRIVHILLLYHFTFYVIFKLKHVFSSTVLTIHTPNNYLSIIYHENNIQSPIRTYSNIALCEHWVIFYVPEGIPSIKFHFATVYFAPSCVISFYYVF